MPAAPRKARTRLIWADPKGWIQKKNLISKFSPVIDKPPYACRSASVVAQREEVFITAMSAAESVQHGNDLT